MRFSTTAACAAWLALIVGCARTSEPTTNAFKTSTDDIEYLMHYVLEPSAEKIWDSAGSIVTAAGEETLHPTTEEGWIAIEHAAAVISESGNLLMIPGRAAPAPDWTEYSQGLVDTGKTVLEAAKAKDPDALFETGGHLYNVCVACHQVYWREAPQRP
ncbi:MAG: hypothetical protein CMQ29_15740 [Gammaproteobacteria bacterium]|jgi:hypothetical protein|nr:hypothetical protein [Gammaproteobacteria bacterium]